MKSAPQQAVPLQTVRPRAPLGWKPRAGGLGRRAEPASARGAAEAGAAGGAARKGRSNFLCRAGLRLPLERGSALTFSSRRKPPECRHVVSIIAAARRMNELRLEV